MSLSPRFITGMLFIILLFTEGSAQINLSYRYNYAEFDAKYENQLLFRLNNTNFFKNNEYFGLSTEGYTLLGYNIAPTFIYYAGSRLRLQAGLNAQKYHGEEKFSEISPIISAQLKLTHNLDLIMGSLRGNIHHRLSEPMYDDEWQYTQPVENGFQFIYNTDRLWADTWINWEQFIQSGDTIPEIFTVGINITTNLLKSESGWKINIPTQMLARHIGGQVNKDDTPMQTVVNLSFGLDASKKTGGFLNSVGWFGNWLTYSDVTNSNSLGVNKGNALYTGIKAEGKKGLAMIGFWNANNFIAPKGSPLFQSISTYDPLAIIPHRQLLTGKLGYYRTFLTQICFSFLFEGYYDIPNKQFDYAYGIHLSFTPNFVIARIPFF